LENAARFSRAIKRDVMNHDNSFTASRASDRERDAIERDAKKQAELNEGAC